MRLLLPLLPPAGFSTLVVVTAAVLLMLRAGLPGMKLGRAMRVTEPASPLASVPMVQVIGADSGVITAPAAMLQVLPALEEAIDSTVRPVSAGLAKLKLSLKATPKAGDGPLLRNDST